jgi:hypothetical protein
MFLIFFLFLFFIFIFFLKIEEFTRKAFKGFVAVTDLRMEKFFMSGTSTSTTTTTTATATLLNKKRKRQAQNDTILLSNTTSVDNCEIISK